MASVVRRYDKFNLKSTQPVPRYKTKLLEGLTFLLHVQPRSVLQVVSLTAGRQLRRQEYILVTQESFLPTLASVLPLKPGRVGDTWPVPRDAAAALLGEIPNDEGYDLTAEILDVHKNGANPSMVAVIGVTGQAVVSEGPSGINARIQFIFVPAQDKTPLTARAEGGAIAEKAAGKSGHSGGRPDPATDAKGYIGKVSLAQEISVALQGNDGRFKQLIRRNLVVERRVNPPGEINALLDLPNPEPEPDEANSWLIYDDPQGLYHFLQPQEMQVAMNYAAGGIDLVEQRHEGPDAIHLTLLPKTEDRQRDRLAADPSEVKRLLEEDWKRQHQKVVSVPSGWLPKGDWAPLKREVYRIEAALIPEDDKTPSSGRIYFDQYIVKFMRDEVLMVTAMTISDPHAQFREKVERIIKSFELGPSDLSLPVAPNRVPARSPARVPGASTATPPARPPATTRPD